MHARGLAGPNRVHGLQLVRRPLHGHEHFLRQRWPVLCRGALPILRRRQSLRLQLDRLSVGWQLWPVPGGGGSWAVGHRLLRQQSRVRLQPVCVFQRQLQLDDLHAVDAECQFRLQFLGRNGHGGAVLQLPMSKTVSSWTSNECATLQQRAQIMNRHSDVCWRFCSFSCAFVGQAVRRRLSAGKFDLRG
jgi:hypothetical protein